MRLKADQSNAEDIDIKKLKLENKTQTVNCIDYPRRRAVCWFVRVTEVREETERQRRDESTKRATDLVLANSSACL